MRKNVDAARKNWGTTRARAPADASGVPKNRRPKQPANSLPMRGRPFGPGNPGGPGRPEGSRNKATLALDAIAEESAKAILEKLIQAAGGGDLRAAEIILARAWPVRKGRPVTLDIPPIVTAGDIVAALGAVASAMAAGDLTPEEGASVANVLVVKRRSIETADLASRIEALENESR